MPYRFLDFIKNRSRSPAIRAQMAAAGFYEVATDAFGALRHNAGGRSESLFDLIPHNPAVGLYARNVYIPFLDAYDVDTTNRWTEGSAGTGTALTVQDAVGNKAKFTNGSADNNNYSYILNYEKAQLIAGKDIWFWTSIEIGDVDQADMFVGLVAKLGSGNIFDNRVDCIGFVLADGSALLTAVCTKDSTGAATEFDTSLTLEDDTEYWVGFHSNGVSYVDFFAGVVGKDEPSIRVRIRTNLPDDEILAPGFGLRNGQAVANSMIISDIRVIADR